MIGDMTATIDSQKQKFYNIIDNVLANPIFNSLDSIKILIYILQAYFEGKELGFSIDNSTLKSYDVKIEPSFRSNLAEDENSLLEFLDCLMSDEYFSGAYAKCAYTLHEAISLNFDSQSFKRLYPFALDYIIQKMMHKCGKEMGISTTPVELAKLINKLLFSYDCKNIYNPFSGLCTIALQNDDLDCDFYCQEVDDTLCFIANLLEEAHGRYISTMETTDSFEDWLGTDTSLDFDAIVGDVPIGLDIEPEQHGYGIIKRSEEFPFYAALNAQNAQYGIYILPASCCYGRVSSELRKSTLAKNLVDMIIELPNRLFSFSSYSACIVIFNTQKADDNVKLVNASDCFLQDKSSRCLDLAKTWSLIESIDDTEEAISMTCDALIENDGNILPSEYAYKKPNIKEGECYIKLADVVKSVRRFGHVGDGNGVVISSDDLSTELIDIISSSPKTKVEEIGSKEKYIRIEEPCIITTPAFRSFYLKKDRSPIYVPRVYEAFYPKDETTILPEYLVYAIQQAISDDINRQKLAFGRRVMSFLRIIIPRLEEQKTFVAFICEEGSLHQAAKDVAEKINTGINNSSAELLHELGLAFTRIGSGIALLEDENNKTITDSLSANVRFSLRMINSAGANYEGYVPSLNPVSIVETIQQYVNEWDAFGYKSFRLGDLKTELSKDVKVNIDPELLYTALDCIMSNAHIHAFSKIAKPENSVYIELTYASLYGELTMENYILIRIGNNGIPFNDNLTVERFAERGYTSLMSGHKGLGGDHISKIMHLFDGLTSLERAEGWSYVNLLLPVYLVEKEYLAEVYEEDCI